MLYLRVRRTFIILSFLLFLSLRAEGQFLYHLPPPGTLLTKPDTTEVMIIGDVMMHKRQLEHDHSWFLRYIEPHMQKADFCIANMEFALGGPPYTGYPAFSTPDWYADYVARCGADVFLLANNHILDRGRTGFERTLMVYGKLRDSLGTRFTGAGVSPLILQRRGLNIALVNFTYGTNVAPETGAPDVMRMQVEQVRAAIDSARRAGADFIVALPHWGTEYRLQHDRSQERWARLLVSEGCCAVVGAHPHVVQDTTHIDGAPVIYSMGNAVSNMSAENTRLELAVTLRFVRDPVSGRKSMLEPQLDWMWCTLPGKLTPSYATILIKEWATRRSEWLIPSDFDNMMATLDRVRAATGIR